MSNIPDDVFTEPEDISPDTLANLGPLRRLAGIWQQVLQVHRIGAHDNFFDLGGHSLMATQVISRIREAFDAEVPLIALFENPTIAGLAAVIRARIASPELAAAGREVGEL